MDIYEARRGLATDSTSQPAKQTPRQADTRTFIDVADERNRGRR
jgi:hypothetical protein